MKYSQLDSFELVGLRMIADKIDYKFSETEIAYTVHLRNGFAVRIAKNDHTEGHEFDRWEATLLKDGKIAYGTDIIDPIAGDLSDHEAYQFAASVIPMDTSGHYYTVMPWDEDFDSPNNQRHIERRYA